jgi:hypothetical protein
MGRPAKRPEAKRDGQIVSVAKSAPRLLLALVGSLSVGCYPALPPQFAESTDVLDARAVSLTVAGGISGLAENCCRSGSNGRVVGGGDVRARVGVGAKQEVGASVFAGLGDGSPIPSAVGGKVSYKVAPIPWMAVVAGGGAMALIDSSTTAVVGGDLAAIVSPYTGPRGTQIYSGARGSFAVPILEGAHGATEALTVPLGAAVAPHQPVRYFVEVGAIVARSQFRDEKNSSTNVDATTLGGYVAAAVAFVLR